MKFVEEWFAHEKWWFNADSDVDLYLKDKYFYLLDLNQSDDAIEQIIIYDQLPRHFFRKEPCAHVIEYYLLKALQISKQIDLLVLNNTELCFALLPWRHSKDNALILKALNIVWARLECSECRVLTRFLKATYERMPIIGSDLRQEILDFDRSILQHDESEPIYDMKFVDINSNKKIIISLSGGVDSMVCSWLLANTCPGNVVAVHVNYNNRTTSDDETNFVVWWCSKIGIPCYVRKLHEIRRDPCMIHGLRSTYELYTRNVRFHCYKEFGEEYSVILGHNKDDVLENIFTNISHKAKFDNLDGMSESSFQNGIHFLRPLLGKTKTDIYEYAYAHNIPFLPPSTPSWCHRGQIRSKIVPSLNSWDTGFVSGLYELSDHMKDMIEIINSYINDITSKDSIILSKLETSNIFWRLFLAKLGITPSDKCIKELCGRLKSWKRIDDFNIPLTKNKTLCIKNIGLVCIVL